MARDLLLVVPDAADDRAGRRRLALAAALAGLEDTDLQVLCWTGGPLLDAFEDTAGAVVDAGTVNQAGSARLLARAGLRPGARLVKNRLLRSLLAPLARIPYVVVDGLGALPALDWLAPGSRNTAVVVRAPEIDGDGRTEALAGADLLVATSPAVERWLLDTVGTDPGRIARHALLDGPVTTTAAGERTGLVGWTADEVAEIIGGLATTDPGGTFTWFVDEERSWPLWHGPTASPLARQVRIAPPPPTATALADLRTLLVGSRDPDEADVTAAAGVFGVPVRQVGRRAAAAAVAAAREPGPGPDRPDGWTVDVATGAKALRAALTADARARPPSQ